MVAMSVPEALRDPRLKHFPLRRVRIPCAGGTLSMVVPRSLNAVLELDDRSRRVARGASPMPYWAEIWPASVAVARAVMRGPDLAGRRALDLGCGLGLGGAACGARGAAVVLCDRDPDALRFARFNAERNGALAAEVVALDWQHETAPGECDLLVLADVAYEPRHCEPLLRHLRTCLSPRGWAWFADPHRSEGDRFLAAAGAEFAVSLSEVDTHFAGVRAQLRLARISKA